MRQIKPLLAPRKLFTLSLLTLASAFFINHAFLTSSASAYGQGSHDSPPGLVGGKAQYSGVFWNYFRWTTDKNMTYPSSLYEDPVGSGWLDIGPTIYDTCRDSKGFWVLHSNTADLKGYSGVVHELKDYENAYRDRAASKYGYWGVRLLGNSNPDGYAYVSGYEKDGKPGLKSGAGANYNAAKADYEAFRSNHPEQENKWANGTLTFFCDAGDNKNEFKSKSGVSYNNQTEQFTDFDSKATIPAATVSDSSVHVKFYQRIYLKINNVDDVSALNNFKPVLQTKYTITSSTGNMPTKSATALATTNSNWRKDGEYFIFEEIYEKDFTINPGTSMKICQGIKYDPKKFSISSDNKVTYSDKGESEICISFNKGDEPVPQKDYCPNKYDANISYGSTYGWSQINDLTTNQKLNTMDSGDDSTVAYVGQDTVTIYARPGDTISFAHALCYGAQKVRSSNNKYIAIGAGRSSKRNLKENEFEIYGATRLASKETVNSIDQYSHDTNYDFGKYNSAGGGVIGAGRLKLIAGINEYYSKANPALLKVRTGAENADHEGEQYKEVKVNNVSHWGFYVESPYGLTNDLECVGVYYKNFKKGGYQISSAYKTGSCNRFYSTDVGKGIAQKLIYNDVKNWIKEFHKGTNAQYHSYWCGCNPRKYYHDELATTGKDAPWHPEGTGYGDDKDSYTDLVGDNLVTKVYLSINDIKNDPLGGPGNWGRERSGKTNTDASGDAPVNTNRSGKSSDTSSEIKYNNDRPDEKNSTFSIGNYGTIDYATLSNMSSKAGWNYFSCSGGGECKDTWREYAVTDDEHDNPIMPNFKDETTTTPQSNTSPWQDTKPADDYTQWTGTMWNCNGSWQWSQYCKDTGSAETRQSSYWTSDCKSGSTKTYTYTDYYGNEYEGSYWSCDEWGDPYEVFYTEYYWTCPSGSYGGGYWTISSYDPCHHYSDTSKTVYQYIYYNCPGSYPFDAAYGSFSDARGAKWPSSSGHTCYRYHFVCPESYSKDGLSYKVFGDDQYNWPSARCRTHTCDDGKKPNNKNTTTQTDSNEANACSYCNNNLPSKFPTGTGQATLQNVNGYNPSNPKGGEGADGKGSKTDTNRGCQFDVNKRPNYTTAKNQVKSNITNNGTKNDWKIPIEDGEPASSQSYRNGETNTPKADDKTKTAQVLVPYNYYITVGTSFGDNGPVYLGENTSFGIDAQVHPRQNSAVYGGPTYATYTRSEEEGGTNLQAVVFIVRPSQKASFTGQIDASKIAQLGSNSEICSVLFGDYQCFSLAYSEKGVVFNADGNPAGTDIIKGTDYQFTVPDDPSQVEVGSLLCVAAAVYPVDSHATGNGNPVNGMSTFNGAKWGVSGTSCRTVSKKPNFQVWNGGVYTEASIKTSISDKAPSWKLQSAVEDASGSGGPAHNGSTNQLASDSDLVAFGSWAEYAVTAGNVVENFASAAANGYGYAKNYDEYKKLYMKQTISNNNTVAGSTDVVPGYSGISGVSPTALVQKLLGRYSGTPENAVSQFPLTDKAKQLSGTSTGTASNSNAFFYRSASAVNIPGATVSSGTHLILSSGRVTISGNICIGGGSCSSPGTETLTSATDSTLKTITKMYLGGSNARNSTTYTSISALPQVIIIAPEIYIDPSVTQVDAWLIGATATVSGGSVNVNGTVNTCNSAVVDATTCYLQLMINGPVIARRLDLNRTGGAHQGAAKITGTSTTSCSLARLDLCNLSNNGSATPAEIFNLRPDIYLWAYAQLDRYTQATTTYSRELAPRY